MTKKNDWIKTIRFGEIGKLIDQQRNRATGENFSDAVRRMCNDYLLRNAIKENISEPKP
jgi:hypothetical protein